MSGTASFSMKLNLLNSPLSTIERQRTVIRWLSIISFTGTVLAMVYNVLFQDARNNLELAGFAILFLGSAGLTWTPKVHLATYGMYITAAGIVAFACITEGFFSMSYLFFYPIILSVAILFDRKEQRQEKAIVFSVVGLAMASIAFLYFIEFRPAVEITREEQMIAGYFNILVSGAIFVLGLILVLRANSRRTLALEKAAHDRNVLLAEMNHRIKNNMAVVAGMLSLHAHSAQNEKSRAAFIDAKSRIQSMATVHTMLYQSSEFDSIRLDELAEKLEAELRHIFNDLDQVEIIKKLEPITTDLSTAVPTGLIMNEILSNCYKHGRNIAGDSKIELELKSSPNEIHIYIGDNGPGVDDPDELQSDQSLGMTIIQSLADQIDATYKFRNANGLAFELTIPTNSLIKAQTNV